MFRQILLMPPTGEECTYSAMCGFVNCKILFAANTHTYYEVWKLAQTSLVKPHGRGSEPYDVRGQSAGLLGANRNEAGARHMYGVTLSLTYINPAPRFWRTAAIVGFRTVWELVA